MNSQFRLLVKSLLCHGLVDMAVAPPDRRQQCIDFCNDLTNAAWLACGSLGVLAAAVAVVG